MGAIRTVIGDNILNVLIEIVLFKHLEHKVLMIVVVGLAAAFERIFLG